MKYLLVSLLLSLASYDTLAGHIALPKLELGASLSALDVPNYRGSLNSTTYFFPLPYIKYRGEQLKVDDGIQNVFLDSKNLVLSLSGSGTLPVNNDDNPERAGMDDLDATLELGPSLDYRFAQQKYGEWWLEFPLRLAFTLNGNLDNIGQVFQPRLAWRMPARHLYEWKLRAAIGPIYASGEFHDYYYSVEAGEALTTRPAYNADGGYSGYRSTFTFSKRYGQLWLGGFVRYDSLSGAEIEDSPLISEDDAWLAGIAIGWIFMDRY